MVEPKKVFVVVKDSSMPEPKNEEDDDENSSWITRSKPFKNVVKWAFGVCDNDSTGEIHKDELYTGVILVHLMIAKYAGAAACFPASRETVDKLFDASDEDDSGTIDEEEFQKIMVVCCGQIASRVVLYLALLIVISPGAAYIIVMGLTSMVAGQEWFSVLFHTVQDPIAKIPWLDDMFDWDSLAESLIGKIFFFLAFPIVFGNIDKFYQAAAEGEMLASMGSKKKKKAQ